jgi:hypothetical protein
VASCADYEQLVVHKLFYFLGHSHLGVPEVAHDNLYEAIVGLINRRISALNVVIAQYAADMLIDSFLLKNATEKSQKEQRQCTWKVKQELIIILR